MQQNKYFLVFALIILKLFVFSDKKDIRVKWPVECESASNKRSVLFQKGHLGKSEGHCQFTAQESTGRI